MEKSLWYPKLNAFEEAMTPLKASFQQASLSRFSALQEQGLIRYFHFAHLAALDVLLAYLHQQGKSTIKSAPDATNEAFQMGLISGKSAWNKMTQSRTSLVADNAENLCASSIKLIRHEFYPILNEFLTKMKELRKGERLGLF